MKSAIWILLVLLLGANGDFEDLDQYDDSEEDYDQCFGTDDCKLYSSMDESCACHHRQFPSETLEQRYGENVKKCCNFHGYRFQNHDCEV